MARVERWVPGLRLVREYRRSWLASDLIAGLVLTALLVPVGRATPRPPGCHRSPGCTRPSCRWSPTPSSPSRVMVLGPDSSLAAVIAAVILPLGGDDPETAVAPRRGPGRPHRADRPGRGHGQNGVRDRAAVAAGAARLSVQGSPSPSSSGSCPGCVGSRSRAQACSSRSSLSRECRRPGEPRPPWPSGRPASSSSWSEAVLAGRPRGGGGRARRHRRRDAVRPRRRGRGGPRHAPRGPPGLRLPGRGRGHPWGPDQRRPRDRPGRGGRHHRAVAVLAAQRGETVDPDRELRALGAANLATGFFQGFAISSSSSRTPVAVAAGARSQVTPWSGLWPSPCCWWPPPAFCRTCPYRCWPRSSSPRPSA